MGSTAGRVGAAGRARAASDTGGATVFGTVRAAAAVDEGGGASGTTTRAGDGSATTVSLRGRGRRSPPRHQSEPTIKIVAATATAATFPAPPLVGIDNETEGVSRRST